MNCGAFELLIALYIECDLSESRQVYVESHLQECAACSGLANELRESQALYKGLRLGAVNSTALGEVRRRVLDEVGELEPAPEWVLWMHRLIFSGLHRKTAIAGVVLAALVSGGVWYEHTRVIVERPGEAPVQMARIPSPSSEVLPEIPHRSAVIPRNVRRVDPLEPVAAAPPEESPMQTIDVPAMPESQVSQIPMKFVTDNPDIIIYWLPMDKGD